MNRITHLRLTGLLITAAAFAAFGAPSTALAGKSHQLSPYKVEAHVDLEGEDAGYTLSCPSSDIAIDGMWRIDNVDQDNDWEDPNPLLAAHWAPTTDTPPGIGTSPDLVIRKAVRPMGAYADSSNVSKYHFEFTPLAGADVQIKLWVICLPNPLTGFGHTNTWQFTTPNDTQLTAASPSTIAPTANTAVTTGTCPAKTILIQPGYKTAFTDHHLVYSRPIPTSWNGRSWGWTVYDDDGGTVNNATVTWRCLDVKSSAASNGPHTHKLVFNKKETQSDGTGLNPPKFPGQHMGERQQDCGEQYKALLGGWDITEAFVAAVAAPVVPHHMAMYFLGMDPRIKTRAFKFVNLDNVAKDVTVAVVCFKDRTT